MYFVCMQDECLQSSRLINSAIPNELLAHNQHKLTDFLDLQSKFNETAFRSHYLQLLPYNTVIQEIEQNLNQLQNLILGILKSVQINLAKKLDALYVDGQKLMQIIIAVDQSNFDYIYQNPIDFNDVIRQYLDNDRITKVLRQNEQIKKKILECIQNFKEQLTKNKEENKSPFTWSKLHKADHLIILNDNIMIESQSKVSYAIIKSELTKSQPRTVMLEILERGVVGVGACDLDIVEKYYYDGSKRGLGFGAYLMMDDGCREHSKSFGTARRFEEEWVYAAWTRYAKMGWNESICPEREKRIYVQLAEQSEVSALLRGAQECKDKNNQMMYSQVTAPHELFHFLVLEYEELVEVDSLVLVEVE